jgi:hypothetical protein
MTVLAGTVAFALMLHLLARPRIGVREAALTGAVLALVALVRTNVFPVGGLLLVVFVVQVTRRGAGLAHRARAIGVALAIPVLLAGPLFLYVYDELQNGQLLLTGPDQFQLATSTYSGSVPPRPDDLLRQRVDALPRTWDEFWQAIVLYLRFPDEATPALLALCLVGLVGLALPTRGPPSPVIDLTGADRTVLDLAEPGPPGALSTQGRVVAWLAVGAVVVTYLVMAAQWPFYPTGRYLLPAGIPALTALIAGTGTLAGRLRIPRPVLLAAAGWGLGFLALDLWMAKAVFTSCIRGC